MSYLTTTPAQTSAQELEAFERMQGLVHLAAMEMVTSGLRLVISSLREEGFEEHEIENFIAYKLRNEVAQ